MAFCFYRPHARLIYNSHAFQQLSAKDANTYTITVLLIPVDTARQISEHELRQGKASDLHILRGILVDVMGGAWDGARDAQR